MDVNGTKFHTVNSAADWMRAVDAVDSQDVFWHSDRAELTLLPRLFEFPAQPGAEQLTVDERRGAGADRFGDVFWIAGNEQAVNVQFLHRGEVGEYWHLDQLRDRCKVPGNAVFRPKSPIVADSTTRLRGLAVTTDHYLAIGTLNPGGLLVFDLHAGGPPLSWLRWPEEADFRPFDIAPGADGGVWVLDRQRAEPDMRPPVYWRLDRNFRVVGHVVDGSPSGIREAGPFVPKSGPPEECRIEPLPEPFAIDVEASSPPLSADAVSILALPDNSVLVLETNPEADVSVVHRYVDGTHAGTATLETNIQSDSGDFVAVSGHDFALRDGSISMTGEISGHLIVAERQGDQSYVFALFADDNDLTLTLLPTYLPMRRYSGKALILRNDEVHYDLGERWMPLAEKKRPRFERRGTVGGLIFDGTEVGCVWHRLFLDACIPQDATVRVSTRAADEIEALAGEAWFDEPAPYLRAEASELPWHSAYTEPEQGLHRAGTWEILFQGARGRYIEIRLELASTGKRSPALRALRIYYPRFSYLQKYLPAIYEDDVDSSEFVERFLANGEGLLTELEGHIERAEYLLDVRTAPPEYVNWLAGWMGVAFDADWGDARRRLFLTHAELIYRWRGTPIGLRAAIRIATDPCPDESIFSELVAGTEDPQSAYGINALRIVEAFRTRAVPGVTVGDPTQLVGPQEVSPDEDWDPSLGSEPIHALYRNFLTATYGSEAAALDAIETMWGRSRPTSLLQVEFPPVVPDNENEAADWLRFTRAEIGFTYADIRSADTRRYREYLAAIYGRVTALNNAWGLAGDFRFDDFPFVELPDTLPASGTRLFDWIGFVSSTVPIERNAHRFSVLVPTSLNEDLASQTQRLDRVRQVVEQEKPANTNFDVKLYWALFRIGAARVGLDTTLGESSRFVAMVLGREYLAQSYLDHSHPWNVADRSVLGRDRLRESQGVIDNE